MYEMSLKALKIKSCIIPNDRLGDLQLYYVCIFREKYLLVCFVSEVKAYCNSMTHIFASYILAHKLYLLQQLQNFFLRYCLKIKLLRSHRIIDWG